MFLPPNRRAFTLIELLAVIAIVVILLSLIGAGIGSVRESARSVKSISNLRSLHSGVILYANDNLGELPYHMGVGGGSGAAWWHRKIYAYLNPRIDPGVVDISSQWPKTVESIYLDPADKNPYAGKLSYLYNNQMYTGGVTGWVRQINLHGNPVLLVEGADDFRLADQGRFFATRFSHRKRANAIRLGGDVVQSEPGKWPLPGDEDYDKLWTGKPPE